MHFTRVCNDGTRAARPDEFVGTQAARPDDCAEAGVLISQRWSCDKENWVVPPIHI